MKRHLNNGNHDSKSTPKKSFRKDISSWNSSEVISWLEKEDIDQFLSYFGGKQFNPSLSPIRRQNIFSPQPTILADGDCYPLFRLSVC